MCHDKSEKAFILIFFYVKSSCYLSAWPQAEAISQYAKLIDSCLEIIW